MESGSLSTDRSKDSAPAFLRLNEGRKIDSGRWIEASTRERTLNTYLRHNEIQRRLKDELLQEGCTGIEIEVPLGCRYVDAVAWRGSELWFYEVKTAATVRECLREAIGQLLEYALWPGATRPGHLVVVGEPALDPTAAAYLVRLNQALSIPLDYRQIRLEF